MKHWMRRARTGTVRIAIVATVAAAGAVATASPPLACIADPNGGCYIPKTYYVSGTDGTLAVQQQPRAGTVLGWLSEGSAGSGTTARVTSPSS